MVNMIADYKYKGAWLNQCFQMPGETDPERAVDLLLQQLRRKGCEPAAVVVVHGKHRLDELEGLRSGVFEFFYINDKLVPSGRG